MDLAFVILVGVYMYVIGFVLWLICKVLDILLKGSSQ